eukprot:6310816-Amphidinium_carterae.1
MKDFSMPAVVLLQFESSELQSSIQHSVARYPQHCASRSSLNNECGLNYGQSASSNDLAEAMQNFKQPVTMGPADCKDRGEAVH